MSISVNFYSFSKKTNSTKTPAGSGTSYECYLKEPCDMLNPVIGLKVNSPVAWNYCEIHAFRRYYFVREWTFVSGIWYATLAVDAMASWKTEIGNSEQYVLRAASEYDGNIIDMRYPAKTSPDVQHEYKDFPTWGYSFAGGTYVVGIITSQTSGIGAVNYYAFTTENFRKFCNNLLSSTDWCGGADITEISQALFKTLFNPFQYIVSCVWLPFSIPGAKSQTIQIGWNWGLSATCVILSGSMLYGDSIAFTVPPHPDAQTRGLYLHSAPFSQYILTVPPFGRFPLDANIASQTEDITCQVDVDAVTGMGRLQARGGGYTFADVSAMVGVPIQISQITQPLSGTQGITALGGSTVSSALSAFDNALGGNNGIGDGMLSQISSAIANSQAQISTIGSNGSIAGLGPAKFEAIFYHPVDENLTDYGRPLCKRKTINTLSGFILCNSSEISTTATASENNMIQNFMNGGFYYE